jgi:hypothetical protein
MTSQWILVDENDPYQSVIFKIKTDTHVICLSKCIEDDYGFQIEFYNINSYKDVVYYNFDDLRKAVEKVHELMHNL